VALSTDVYPRVHVATSKTGAVGQAGGVLLTKTIRATGQDRSLGEGLSRWRKPMAVHDPGNPLVIDLDATLVTAHSHSEKEKAAGTYLRGFGFHPLTAFVDHGPAGTGEPVAMLLRPGNAGVEPRWPITSR
jgi:Transposase DDE domain group 1